MEKLAKNDFVEIEYTGKIKENNSIFDTNIPEEAKKLELDIKTRPYTICVGQNMILKAIDEFLLGKETSKQYTLNLPPEKAFGLRDRKLIKTMPISVFAKQNINPQQGMVFSFDNLFGKISSVSGGRIIVDFNNPIAGKDVVYEIRIKRKVIDEKEKVKSLLSAFLGRELEFDIENQKLKIKAEKGFTKFLNLFKEKFKEILNLELFVEEIEEKKRRA